MTVEKPNEECKTWEKFVERKVCQTLKFKFYWEVISQRQSIKCLHTPLLSFHILLFCSASKYTIRGEIVNMYIRKVCMDM